MQLSRLAIQPEAVPIENPIGSIRILLDLENNQPCSQRMNPPARQENDVPLFHPDSMKTIGNSSGFEFFVEHLARGTVFQADEQLRAGSGIGDVPHLGFGFSAKLGGFGFGGM